jgi:hypothetical protein
VVPEVLLPARARRPFVMAEFYENDLATSPPTRSGNSK